MGVAARVGGSGYMGAPRGISRVAESFALAWGAGLMALGRSLAGTFSAAVGPRGEVCVGLAVGQSGGIFAQSPAYPPPRGPPR